MQALLYDWSFWARPNQLTPPGQWITWLILAGRGYGKTRTGAEWVRQQVKKYRYVNLIGATADDARDIMIEGESGILSICPPSERPKYLASKRRLEWPNGAKSLIFTADEPERLRGKQHMKLWCDELAAWRYPDSWDQAMFGLRLGDNPQAIVTTTPKPIKLLKELIVDETTYITKGSTYDNKKNLANAFWKKITKKYEGTRLGRQELNAEMLDDIPGALWTRAMIEKSRVRKAPELIRIVVAIDPAATSGETSNDTGIIAAGKGSDGEYYVLKDSTMNDRPAKWAARGIKEYYELKADRIVGETNNGGEMVEEVIRNVDKDVSFKAVHASKGKKTRAEPVSALYEQGRVHHVGYFAYLEDQMCEYVPDGDGPSPDRMDALVWAITELMSNEEREFRIRQL